MRSTRDGRTGDARGASVNEPPDCGRNDGFSFLDFMGLIEKSGKSRKTQELLCIFDNKNISVMLIMLINRSDLIKYFVETN